jgi:hypothetical protein
VLNQTGKTDMKTLQKHHIVDLFVWVDDSLKALPDKPSTPTVGRPMSLTLSEIITILIWDGLTEPHKTLKDTYRFVCREYGDCFPRMPSYKSFVLCLHSYLDAMVVFLAYILDYSAQLRFADATMLPVCKYAWMDSHKVAKAAAKLGANHQGWHYGFKLHASINRNKQLSGVCFTAANEYDAQKMPEILKGATKIVVGDSHYGARVMNERLNKEQGIIVVAPPHYKQKKKVATKLQIKLLKMRTKIEAVFDYLKEHMHLVTSFPRSVRGYFVHYVRVLLGYQVRLIS